MKLAFTMGMAKHVDLRRIAREPCLPFKSQCRLRLTRLEGEPVHRFYSRKSDVRLSVSRYILLMRLLPGSYCKWSRTH